MRVISWAPWVLLLLAVVELSVRLTSELEPDAVAQGRLRASSLSPVHEEPASSRLTEALSRYTPKPENVFRIAVVGDTFTFPTEVGFDDSFSKRLERMLQAKARESEKPIAQVPRYGGPQLNALQKVSYARKASYSNPDLMIIEVDFDDPDMASAGPVPKEPQAVLSKSSPSWLSGSVLQHWKSFAYALHMLERKLDENTSARTHLKLFADNDTWMNFVDSFKLIRQFAAEHDIALVAVVFPRMDAQPGTGYPYTSIHKKIAGELARQRIPCIDLLAEYTGIPLSRIRAGESFEGNEVAQRIAAEAIYFQLEKSGFLSRALRPKSNPGGDSAISSGAI